MHRECSQVVPIFVRPSVRLSVRLSVAKTVNTIFENERNDFDAN